MTQKTYSDDFLPPEMSKNLSHYDFSETVARLEAAIADLGLYLFAKIDHAKGASSIGQMLEPNLLLIFGHPSGGTPLIQQSPAIGIDLPLKILIYQETIGALDKESNVWMLFQPISYFTARHNVTMVSMDFDGLIQKILKSCQ